MAILDCSLMCSLIEEDYNLLEFYHLKDDRPNILKGKSGECRFCKKHSPYVTFNKIAHVVPHFIGNQHFKSEYECDACNQLFSEYESHFAGFMKLYHVFSRVNKGSGKVPKYKNHSSDKSYIKYEDEGFRVVCVEGENLTCEVDEEKKMFTIEGESSYIPQEAFKAITKMALAIMPEDDLTNFQDTLSWLQKQIDCGKGLLLVMRIYRSAFPFISCLIFKRKDDSKNVPSYLFGIAYSNIFLQIPIPLCEKDRDKQGVELSMPLIPTLLDYERVDCISCKPYDLSSSKKCTEPCRMLFGYESLEDDLCHKSRD